MLFRSLSAVSVVSRVSTFRDALISPYTLGCLVLERIKAVLEQVNSPLRALEGVRRSIGGGRQQGAARHEAVVQLVLYALRWKGNRGSRHYPFERSWKLIRYIPSLNQGKLIILSFNMLNQPRFDE